MITPAQCRAARALLNLSARQLAEESSISLRSVQGFERGEHALRSVAMAAIERIFGEKGVVFHSDHEWLGVKMKTPNESI